MKKQTLILALAACLMGIAVTIFLLFNTSGPDASRMKIIYIALIILLLHGCYRAAKHIKSGGRKPEIIDTKKRLEECYSTRQVVVRFFDPRDMHFRTSLNLFILVAAALLASPVVFQLLLALTILVKALLLWKEIKYANIYQEAIVKIMNSNIEDEKQEIDEVRVNDIVDMLTQNKRQCIYYAFTPQNTSPLPIGSSKFGGQPDVPDTFRWPTDKSGRPLSLLLQIDCADTAPHDEEHLLPSSGHLYFFYELGEMDWESKNGNVRVIYHDSTAGPLHRCDFPDTLAAEYRLKECALQFSRHDSYISFEDLCDLSLQCNYDDCDNYYEAIERLKIEHPNEDECIGSMLGYADLVQNAIVDNLDEQVLLLQLFSIEAHGDKELMFGDCGTIYFYMSREALQKKDFDQLTFELQCF